MVIILHLLGTSDSVTIFTGTTMLKDENDSHLALLPNSLNPEQSSGLQESNQLPALALSPLAAQEPSGQRDVLL